MHNVQNGVQNSSPTFKVLSLLAAKIILFHMAYGKIKYFYNLNLFSQILAWMRFFELVADSSSIFSVLPVLWISVEPHPNVFNGFVLFFH